MIALFPGSFDPFTKGHANIVERTLPLFDKLIIGIGYNPSKTGLFTPEERKLKIERYYQDNPRVEVVIYKGLTTDCAEKVGAHYLIRAVRSNTDVDMERQIAEVNKKISGVETLVFFSDSELSSISSSVVRELLSFGKDVSEFLP